MSFHRLLCPYECYQSLGASDWAWDDGRFLLSHLWVGPDQSTGAALLPSRVFP